MKSYFLKVIKKIKYCGLYVLFFTSAHHSFSQTHGNYIDFTQGSGYLETITSPSIIPNGDFTIEFWFKSCLESPVTQTFFDNATYIRVEAVNYYSRDLFNVVGCVKTHWLTSKCVIFYQNPPDSIITWHHVAFTYKKLQDEWNVYYDGVNGSYGRTGDNISTTVQFLLGNNAYKNRPYYGLMDDFRISNQVLYPADFTPPTNELAVLPSTIALYNFNQPDTSTRVYDSSGNGYHLNIIGSVRFKTQDTIMIDSTDGVYTVTGSEGPFQWYNCDSNEIVPGADSSVFTPIISGNYSLYVGYSKCGFRSPCKFYFVEPEDTIHALKTLQVYPNPFYNQFYINKGDYDQLLFRIIDRTGRLVYEGNTKGQITEVDFSKYSRGIYFIVLYDEEIVLSEKVMKL
jgi:hypothetical protein